VLQQFAADAVEGGIVRERAQELVVSGVRLVRPAEDCVDDPQSRPRADTLAGQTGACADDATIGRCVLQGAHHCRADGDNAATRLADRRGCGGRYEVGLIER
jgi:hypothetical protein